MSFLKIVAFQATTTLIQRFRKSSYYALKQRALGLNILLYVAHRMFPYIFLSVIQCSVPQVVNGDVTGCMTSSVGLGEDCVFRCNDGYLTRNHSTSARKSCQTDETFSGPEFSCDGMYIKA